MLGFLVAVTALAGGLDARPAPAQPTPGQSSPSQSSEIRVVTMRAVADEMYRA